MWFKKKITPTGRVIDMTRTYWGHNLSLTKVDGKKGTMEFSIWNSTAPVVGDTIIWKSASGRVRSVIHEVKSAPSVWDMYFIKVGDVALDG